MTFRTKSRSRQWTVWLCAALVAVAVQAVATRLVLGSVSMDLLDPDCYRLALPIVLVFGLLVWETRWNGIRSGMRNGGWGKREQGEVKAGGESRRRAEGKPDSAGQTVGATSCRVRKDGEDSNLTRKAAASTEKTDLLCPSPPHLTTSPTQPSVDPASGEALFGQARALPHQEIPDFEIDAEYLDLLGNSAAAGYAPALAKLGEYAMRRAAWVEAYYWMSMAKRQGMHGLANVMREIRKNWSLDGFPDEAENANPLFTLEAGSVGRALLHADSGHAAAKARDFLKATHPEFLT